MNQIIDIENHMVIGPYDRPTETAKIYREARADDLLCDALNLRNMEWLDRAKEGDLLVNLVTAVLSSKSSEEAGVHAYRLIEEEAEIWADNEAEAEQ